MRVHYLCFVLLVAMGCGQHAGRQSDVGIGQRKVHSYNAGHVRQRFQPSPLVGSRFFTCCNIWFDHVGDSSDANYRYLGGRFLPAGTEVEITNVLWRKVAFWVPGTEQTFTLRFAYGTGEWSFDDYFKAVLRKTNPIGFINGETAALVATKTLAVGMTREQAIMTRGYPPRHRTPSFDDDEWLYYLNPSAVQLVRFENDRIVSIEDGAAP